uniref:Craniofacial development protein 2 n=2 Tax=Cacopsylla melanoneura TaxID=428564 RepID=A0A8D9ACT3_9HEMI
MSEAGTLRVIENEMKNYNLEILGLNETRWNGFGEMITQEGNTLLYSGNEDENAPLYAGVGILLSRAAKRALLDWKPISDRIITARLNSKVRKISIVVCYGPTEGADEAAKDRFYETLDDTLTKIKKQDIKILLGDVNAKLGPDNSCYETVMGKHGEGIMNENGTRFADLCLKHELVIGGTLFPHKRCHKLTWTSPNGQTKNQIDHVAVSRKWRTSLLDTRARRGADCGSDHHLVTSDVRLKIASIKTQNQRTNRPYNTEALRRNRNTANEFVVQLTNRYEALNWESNNIEENWTKVKELFQKTSEETLGHRESRKNPWISQTTWEKVQERRQLKIAKETAQGQDTVRRTTKEFNDKHKEDKRSFRADKRKWAEDLATKAQEAEREGDIKELYKITKTLSNRKTSQQKPIRDKYGHIIVGENEQLRRWREHFQELLNPNNTDNILPQENFEENLSTTNNISEEPPTKNEIQRAIKELKNGKAPGIDNLPPEIFKQHPSITADILHTIFKQIWETDQIPLDWKKGLLVKLPKKGDLTECKNWRGITLLSIPSKILTRIILNRIKDSVDQKLRREQAGFRKDCSCVDLINTLRIILEQSTEFQTPLYAAFIDFEKAFDSIDRRVIWSVLKEYGVPQKLINLIKETYNEYQCQVIHRNNLTESFPVQIGVKQGCLLSPIIFLMVLDRVMRKVTDGKRRGIRWTLTERLEDIDYADDLCLLSHNINDMKNKIKDLIEEGKKVGLKINEGKTKELRINNNNNEDLIVNGQKIERVKEFQYLGSIISEKGGTDEDIKSRINKAKAAFAQLRPIWRSHQLRRHTKIRIFESNVKSVLLYGCQTWKVSKEVTGKLQTFINSRLRYILNIHWPDKISNQDLWKRCNQSPVDVTIKQRKYGWIGHVLRRQNNIAKEALVWNPQGKRKQGRPRITWKRTVEQEIAEEGKSWGEIKALAQNRVRWRSFVEALRPPRDHRT